MGRTSKSAQSPLKGHFLAAIFGLRWWMIGGLGMSSLRRSRKIQTPNVNAAQLDTGSI
jgi:hypothetical protein